MCQEHDVLIKEKFQKAGSGGESILISKIASNQKQHSKKFQFMQEKECIEFVHFAELDIFYFSFFR